MPLTPEQQADIDRNTFKVKLIANGFLVNVGGTSYAFSTWEAASKFIDARVKERAKFREAKI